MWFELWGACSSCVANDDVMPNSILPPSEWSRFFDESGDYHDHFPKVTFGEIRRAKRFRRIVLSHDDPPIC